MNFDRCMSVFNYNTTLATQIYVVKQNDNLFAVMSKVTKANALGQKKDFINLVAECNTQKESDLIVAEMERVMA